MREGSEGGGVKDFLAISFPKSFSNFLLPSVISVPTHPFNVSSCWKRNSTTPSQSDESITSEKNRLFSFFLSLSFSFFPLKPKISIKGRIPFSIFVISLSKEMSDDSQKKREAAMASHHPYWYGDAGDDANGPRDKLPAVSSDISVDFLVIGGGYTGMSVARELKKRHPEMNVAICEGKFVGFGASGRNGGYITPLVGRDFQHLIDDFGMDSAKKMTTLMQKAVKLVCVCHMCVSCVCEFVFG